MPDFKVTLKPVIPVAVAVAPPPHIIAFLSRGNAVTNTTDALSLFDGSAGVEDLLLPANIVPVGAGVVFCMVGDGVMAASGTPPLTIEITANEIVLARAEYTKATAMNNRTGRFTLDAAIIRETTSTSATGGVVRIGADDENQASTQVSLVDVAPVDFSQHVILDITAKWGAASTAASIRNGYCKVELCIPRSVDSTKSTTARKLLR